MSLELTLRLIEAVGATAAGSTVLVPIDGSDDVETAARWAEADRLELTERDAQGVTEVDDRETGLPAGGAPLAGHGVGLGPANPDHPGRFLDGQQVGKTSIGPHLLVMHLTGQ